MNLKNNALRAYNADRREQNLPPISPGFKNKRRFTVNVSKEAYENLQKLALQFANPTAYLQNLIESLGTYQLHISLPTDEYDETDNMWLHEYQDDGYNDAVDGEPDKFMTTYKSRTTKAFYAYKRGYLEGKAEKEQ